MSSGADKANAICCMSPDNRHNYRENLNSRETLCIYCDDVLITEAEQAAGIKAGDALTKEVPGNRKAKTNAAPKSPGGMPLDRNDINTLTGAFEMYGRIMAIQARVDGMNVKNAGNVANGFNREYYESDFKRMADNMMVCVKELQLMQKYSR